MRLIDADALMRKFKTASPMAIDGRARQMLEEMPTIEERKRGKWIKDEALSEDHVETIFLCSAPRTIGPTWIDRTVPTYDGNLAEGTQTKY